MPLNKALMLPPAGSALRRGYETEFLPAALEIAHTPASPTARLTAAVIVAAVVTAVVWSAIGRVDIVATAPGKVIPAGMSKVVQPLEAGVIRSIRVEDGDHVHSGQVLFELDVTIAEAERERAARELRKEELEAAGLQALYHDLNQHDGLASFVPPENAPAMEIDQAKAEIAARRATGEAKLADLDQQMAGVQAQQQENAATLSKLAASIPWLAQKVELYRQLLNVQFTNRLAWLDSEQALADAQAAVKVQEAKKPELVAALGSLGAQRRQNAADYAHDVLKDLAEAEAKAGELRQQLAEATHRAQQTVLASPIDGTVQQLGVHTIGGVVTPAEALLVVVPDDGPMLIEATVENGDIGFVHAGQDVEVKVHTFEFTRYGLLHGHVVDVSRDRVDDTPTPKTGAKAEDVAKSDDGQSKEPGYVVHVALDVASMVVDGRLEKLSPGMAVTAEIKTGRRRIISYLLSPIARYRQESLRER